MRNIRRAQLRKMLPLRTPELCCVRFSYDDGHSFIHLVFGCVACRRVISVRLENRFASEALSGQDAAVYCLGTYTGAVSDAELRTTTVNYTIEFARVLRGSSPDAAFSFLSGNGADPTGRVRIPFARYKGQAENARIAAGFPSVYIFRPAYIYPVEPRKEPNFSYRLMRAIYPCFGRCSRTR